METFLINTLEASKERLHNQIRQKVSALLYIYNSAFLFFIPTEYGTQPNGAKFTTIYTAMTALPHRAPH